MATQGNNKRIASCKKVGKEKKETGHKREKDFIKQYNPIDINADTEYGATSDTTIDKTNAIYAKLCEELKINGNNVSNKSGKNIQFTLGSIPELEKATLIKLQNKQYMANVFNIYLKKINSKRPANVLVYKYAKKYWVFFNMDDIIEYICNKCEWRILESGRIKGDFIDESKKGKRQYLTYEYRPTHKSYFLGLNGGKGLDFIDLLMNKKHGIKYITDAFNY